MWLYKATGKQSYLIDAKGFVDLGVAWSLGWDDKKLACQGKIMEKDIDETGIKEMTKVRENEEKERGQGKNIRETCINERENCAW